jgi:hypothetical protein
MNKYTVSESAAAISVPAARVSIASSVVFVVLLVVLHFMKPEFHPSWRFISEYAIGDYGWVMMLAFISMAISCAALFVATRSQIPTLLGRIGMALLLLVSVALVAAGLFAMDPITATPDQLTTHGKIHGLASMIGVPGLPIAAVLISWSLSRNQAWSWQHKGLLWTSLLTLICLVAMFAYIGTTLPKVGGFGPDVSVGWFNRLLVLSYVVWLVTASWSAIKVREQIC